jgi:YesN/AraC family two-component response regulator
MLHGVPWRILVVDDVRVVGEGLRPLLASGHLEICGEAENGQQAIDQVRALRPNLVLIDINIP